MSHPEPDSTGAADSEEKEDVKPQTLPLTESNLPTHHSGGEHYSVLVMKTEGAPFGAHVPVVIPEEKPHVEQQTVASDDVPVQLEGQSFDQRDVEQKYEQELVEKNDDQIAVEEPVMEPEIDEERDVVEDDQEQRVLHSREEETEAFSMHEPGDVVEQMHEQHQEEIAEDPFANQQRFASDDVESIPVQDASVSWTQETAPMDTQEPDEFYTPEEQNIPQSHSYAEEYEEESYDGDVLVSSSSHEPWLMVDYPQAPEQENYLPPDDINAHQEEPVEMLNERFAPEVPEEMAEQVYHNEEEGEEVEEAEEPPAVEVCS